MEAYLKCQTSHGTETPQRCRCQIYMEQKHFRTVDMFHLRVRTTTLSDLAPYLGDGLFLANTLQPITEDFFFFPLTHRHKSTKHNMQTLRQIVRRGGRIIPCVYSLFAVLMSCFFGVRATLFLLSSLHIFEF